MDIGEAWINAAPACTSSDNPPSGDLSDMQPLIQIWIVEESEARIDETQ